MGCTRPGGVGGNLGWGNGERARCGASKSIEWSALQMGDKECTRGACPLAFSTAGIHGVDAGMSACPVVSASPGMGAAEAGVSPGECSGKDTSSPSRKVESALTSSGISEGELPSGGMVCVTLGVGIYAGAGSDGEPTMLETILWRPMLTDYPMYKGVL